PGDFLQDADVQGLLGHDLLEARVLFLQLPESLRLIRLHAAVLGPPAVERGLADPQLLGDLGDRSPARKSGLGIPQLADNLFRGVSLALHRVSSCPPRAVRTPIIAGSGSGGHLTDAPRRTRSRASLPPGPRASVPGAAKANPRPTTSLSDRNASALVAFVSV